jgi:hypothetical protein
MEKKFIVEHRDDSKFYVFDVELDYYLETKHDTEEEAEEHIKIISHEKPPEKPKEEPEPEESTTISAILSLELYEVIILSISLATIVLYYWYKAG